MEKKKLDSVIVQLENHIECWKQFNHFLNLARNRKFEDDDENQFLEIKSVLAQELETILAFFEEGTPSKEEVHTLLGQAPSLRSISELNEGSVRGLENQWHKIFIGWQSILGQLKVAQREPEKKSFFGRLFGK